jgi:hypothetical protein
MNANADARMEALTATPPMNLMNSIILRLRRLYIP